MLLGPRGLHRAGYKNTVNGSGGCFFPFGAARLRLNASDLQRKSEECFPDLCVRFLFSDHLFFHLSIFLSLVKAAERPSFLMVWRRRFRILRSDFLQDTLMASLEVVCFPDRVCHYFYGPNEYIVTPVNTGA